jgi:hypothetical protein
VKRALPVALVALIPMGLAACASTASPGDTPGPAAVVEDAAPRGSSTVTLTRAGEAVQLTEDAESTHECEFVTHLPLTGTSVHDVNAIRELRNEAGRSGANFVLLVMETRTTIARAEGYLCAD